MKLSVGGRLYELVKSDTAGCDGCDLIEDIDCDTKTNSACFMGVHKCKHPMIFKEIKEEKND